MVDSVPKEIYDIYFSSYNDQIKKLNEDIVKLKAVHNNTVKKLNNQIDQLEQENKLLKNKLNEAEMYPMNPLLEREMKRMVARITELENQQNSGKQKVKPEPVRKTLSQQQRDIESKNKKSIFNIFSKKTKE